MRNQDGIIDIYYSLVFLKSGGYSRDTCCRRREASLSTNAGFRSGDGFTIKVMQGIIEKDYALSYVLAGISSVPDLSETLIFKGGTALKKFFFGDYRFSEDLDFSTIDAPKGNNLERVLNLALNKTLSMLSSYGPFSGDLERYLEKELHIISF